jgi:hypothetical protein
MDYLLLGRDHRDRNRDQTVFASSGESSADEIEVGDEEEEEVGGTVQTDHDTTPVSSEDNNPNDTDYFTYSDDESEVENLIELELPEDFILTLVDHYGNQPGADIYQERKIMVSPAMCFDIFRLLYNKVEKQGGSSALDGMMNHQRDLQGRHKQEQVVASSSSSSSNASSSNCSNSSPCPPVHDEDEEDDLPEILRQIAAMEEENCRAFAKELDELTRVGMEEAAVAGFKDIMEKDKIIQARELQKAQQLRKIKWTMAQNIKCSQLKALFPSLESKLVEDFFLQSDFKYEQALSSLKSVYPLKFVEKIPRQESQPVARHR